MGNGLNTNGRGGGNGSPKRKPNWTEHLWMPLLVLVIVGIGKQISGSPILDESRFLAYGTCFRWDPWVLWIHALADAIIAQAYFVIPTQILYISLKRNHGALTIQDIQQNAGRLECLIKWFVAFILLSGTMHVLDVWNLWRPHYWIDAMIRIMTAVASVGAEIDLGRALPELAGAVTVSKLQLQVKALAAKVQALEDRTTSPDEK